MKNPLLHGHEPGRRGGDLFVGTLQFPDLDIPPLHADASTFVDLQGDESFALADLLIREGDHLVSVKGGGHLVAIHFDDISVPVSILQPFLVFGLGLNEPAASVGFIDAAGMIAGRGHFSLPAADLHTFDGAPEEDAAVAVRFLFEFQGKDEILVALIGGQVAILFVGAAFTDQQSFFCIPFLRTVVGPPRKVFAVEEGGPFLTMDIDREQEDHGKQEGSFHF